MRRAQSSRKHRGRSEIDDLRGLLGALADISMDAHFTAVALTMHLQNIIDGTASAEERRAHADRLKALQRTTGRIQAAILGRTDAQHDGTQTTLKLA